jgi:hypothetical protein
MVWHVGKKNSNDLVRHATNSKAWAHIDAMWPNFGNESHNLRLGLAIDGFYPCGEKRNS